MDLIAVASWHRLLDPLTVIIALLLFSIPVWIAWAMAQEYGPNRVPCLLYHQLRAGHRPGGAIPDDPVYVCHADRFAEQMDHLREAGYTTISVDDYMAARREKRPLPLKPVLITFDDGFGSIYELAFPILRRNGQKATIFMTPDRNSHNFKAYADQDRPLKDAELRHLSENGIDIQSHGLSHRFLTELDDAEVHRELRESRDALESVTGKPVRFLAIPGGAYDSRVRRLAREAGYDAVFCMRKGSAGLSTDPFLLPRMVVSRDTTLDDFRRLLTPPAWLQGRIISLAQGSLSRLLGMRRMDALRSWLYASPLAPLLRPRRLVLALLCGFLAGLAVLIVALIV
jgi:peptidoglycan/xylan/chitin deacetylase (PgdA/CDA1 family)